MVTKKKLSQGLMPEVLGGQFFTSMVSFMTSKSMFVMRVLPHLA